VSQMRLNLAELAAPSAVWQPVHRDQCGHRALPERLESQPAARPDRARGIVPASAAYCFIQLLMRHNALIGRHRSMGTLDDLGTFAPLFLQLERWLKEVHVETRRRIEPGHHFRRLNAIEAAVADEPAHDGAVLLLDESLIILLVSACAGHLEFLIATPRDNDL